MSRFGRYGVWRQFSYLVSEEVGPCLLFLSPTSETGKLRAPKLLTQKTVISQCLNLAMENLKAAKTVVMRN